MRTLLIVLISCISTAAFADPVILRIGFDAKGGPVSELSAFIEKASALDSKINPNSKVTRELYVDAFHGSSGGGASLILTYPSVEAWAAADASHQASSEWGQLMATFPAEKYSIDFQGLSRVLYQSDGWTPASGGEFLEIFIMEIKDGGAQALLDFNDKVRALSDKLGLDSKVTISVPIATGSGAGSITVTVRYPSAKAWADADAKISGSQEWQALFADFPANYQTVYSALSVAN